MFYKLLRVALVLIGMNACGAPYLANPFTPQGTVLAAGPNDDGNIYEPTVIHTAAGELLPGPVFRLWYTAGWEHTSINYAESRDGRTWTRYSANPVLPDARRSCVLAADGGYVMFANLGDAQINRYSSADGLHWQLDVAGAITLGAPGEWNDKHIANCYAWQESPNEWRMLYDGNGYANGQWQIGLATSSDGRTWTNSPDNPVLGYLDHTVGGPFVQRVAGGYLLYAQVSPTNSGAVLPTDIVRYRSPTLTRWPARPETVIAPRLGATEGEGTDVGQTADPTLVEVDGLAYLFYAGSADGSRPEGQQHLVLATAPLP